MCNSVALITFTILGNHYHYLSSTFFCGWTFALTKHLTTVSGIELYHCSSHCVWIPRKWAVGCEEQLTKSGPAGASRRNVILWPTDPPICQLSLVRSSGMLYLRGRIYLLNWNGDNTRVTWCLMSSRILGKHSDLVVLPENARSNGDFVCNFQPGTNSSLWI